MYRGQGPAGAHPVAVRAQASAVAVLDGSAPRVTESPEGGTGGPPLGCGSGAGEPLSYTDGDQRMQLTADKTLDCTGLLCPVPIIKISKAIKEVQPGQTILMLATDPGSKPDMEAWQRRTGNSLLQVEQEGKLYKFLVRRKA